MDLSPVAKGIPGSSVNSSKSATQFCLSALTLAILIILFASPAFALTVTPAKQQLSNPGTELYKFVYTITNNDPVPRTLNLKLEPNSGYMQERIVLEPSQFSLLPGETQNVQFAVSPSGLGPQLHSLVVAVYDGQSEQGKFELSFTIPGTPVEKYDSSIAVDDITSTEPLSVEVTLRNFGNIIGYAQVRLELVRDDEIIGALDYPDLLQVLPNKDNVLTLAYTDRLEPGFYTARVITTYANATSRTEKPFSVTLGATRQVVKLGSDLVFTFQSLGNPPVVVYGIVDSKGKERASGSFLPTSDIIIQTSTLEAGEYTLSLRTRGSTRTMIIDVQDDSVKYRILGILLVIILVLGGLFSLRHRASFTLRVLRLQCSIWRREREVDKLINRAHRLVDRYALHARRNTATGSSRETRQRP